MTWLRVSRFFAKLALIALAANGCSTVAGADWGVYPATDAGSDGDSGSGGSAGDAGTGGDSGSAGSGGDGGSAGSSGVGGAGSGGSAGSGNPQRYRVGGNVSGLDGALVLTMNGDRLTVTNGPFEFSELLDDGASYTLKIPKQPAAQRCSIDEPEGAIRGADVSDIEVLCLGDDPGLESLEISSGTLAPAFDAEHDDYSAVVPLEVASVTLIPTASDATATITVQDRESPSGVATEPVALGLGDNPVSIVVTAPGGATRSYQVLVQRAPAFAEEHFFKPNVAPLVNTYFGSSVALSGETLAIGAPFDDRDAPGASGVDAVDSGGVYVFVREGATWRQQAYLQASNAEAADYFGTSVALSGDTLVVGATGEDANASGIDGDQTANGSNDDDSLASSGAVYVFVRNAGTWVQQAYLKSALPEEFSGSPFGSTLALDGDVLAVGAPGDVGPDVGFNLGSVHVFERVGATWGAPQRLTAFNEYFNGQFGSSLSLSQGTLAIGSRGESGGGRGVNASVDGPERENSGAVYLYEKMGASWAQTTYIKATNPDAGDTFGGSVALHGNLLVVGAVLEASSGTGVGANQDDNQATESGAVYVFVNDGGWKQEEYIKPSNTKANSLFGNSVAVFDDLLLVGAMQESTLATPSGYADPMPSGAAYLFRREANGWTELSFFKASNPGPSDLFGNSVALSATTLVVGAPNEDSATLGIDGEYPNEGGSNWGAVYVRSF